jgi:hypothetical protein
LGPAGPWPSAATVTGDCNATARSREDAVFEPPVAGFVPRAKATAELLVVPGRRDAWA